MTFNELLIFLYSLMEKFFVFFTLYLLFKFILDGAIIFASFTFVVLLNICIRRIINLFAFIYYIIVTDAKT